MDYKVMRQGCQYGDFLKNKVEKICRLSVNPVFIFQELLAEVIQKKITRPGYSTFQKIISAVLSAEQNRNALLNI